MKLVKTWADLEQKQWEAWFDSVLSSDGFLTNLNFSQLFQQCQIRGLLVDGELVAGLCFKQLDDQVREVLFVGSRPKFQRQGYMLSLMEAWFQELVDGQVWLEVAGDNPKALKLYIKLGFSKDSLRKDYYGPGRDCWNLSVNLIS